MGLIGHFENCLAIDALGNCTKPAGKDSSLDSDDTACVPGTDSTVVHIDGCFGDDEDFDRQSYRNDWPGTIPNVARDRALHPSPVLFTSPRTNGRNFSTIAFETDLPGIEVQGAQANPPFCDPLTGANCVNPPSGAVLPVLLDDGQARDVHVAEGWQVPSRHHERIRRQFHH